MQESQLNVRHAETCKTETLDSFGGPDWYNMARSHCSNFETREAEGFCVTLFEPYQ